MTMHMTVDANGKAIVFELNGSTAAQALLAQLPLSVDVENYGGIEKIFYPPKKLDTAGMSPARSCPSGTLAYYAPWGDVVLFYGAFGSAPGLYELGHAVQGGEHIKSLSGIIRVMAEASL
ncbi:MAG: cyclophilin-like fold protein [Desulfovibrionaceae bacterium]